MAGTLQSPGLIKDVYDKLVFTTSAIDADTHDIFMTDADLGADQQIKRLSISSRQALSLSTAQPSFLHEMLCFDMGTNIAYESATATFSSELAFFVPKNGRVISSAISIEGAIEGPTSWVDVGISVWDNDNLDEDFLHTNVTKGWKRLGLSFAGQDLDNYNEVIFDPDTMNDLDTNEFEQGDSILLWWIFHNVNRQNIELTRLNVVLEFDD